jgi:hypothetical protein
MIPLLNFAKPMETAKARKREIAERKGGIFFVLSRFRGQEVFPFLMQRSIVA